MSRKKKAVKALTSHPVVEPTGIKIIIENGAAEVHGFKRHDGGYQWMFKRDGREYPLALSGAGMAAMSRIYHQLASGYPPLPLEHEVQP